MEDLRWEEPNMEEVDVDDETLAAIDEGLRASEEGRVHTSAEVKELLKKWRTESSTPTLR